MITIIATAAWLADLEVETVRTDAVQAFVRQETIFVQLTTDDGNRGVGYSYIIGTGGTSVLAMLRDHLLPRLIGADAALVEQVWYDLFASGRRGPQRPVRRAHPAVAGNHPQPDADRGRHGRCTGGPGSRHRLGPRRHRRPEGRMSGQDRATRASMNVLAALHPHLLHPISAGSVARFPLQS
jgi:Mandelate racemase / muconate lactonizing enzyme, N-terminal domain